MSSNFRQQLEEYLSDLEIKAEKVLDVGGLQNPIRGRTKSWDVQTCKTLDVVESMKDNKADYVGDIGRALDYHADINELERSWDTIFCLEVMEYVIDPVTAIKNIHNFLKIGGEAYISFPFIYPTHPPNDTDFMRYTEAGVRALLHEAGFRDYQVFIRRAGPGRSTLLRFFDEEGMRYRRDDRSLLDHIGYIAYAKRT